MALLFLKSYFIMLYRTVLDTAPLCECKLNAHWSIQWDSTGIFPFSCPFHIYVPGDKLINSWFVRTWSS